MSHKLYVIVDKTLSKSQQTVQACHAVAEFMLKHPDRWPNHTLVILAGEPDEMEHWSDWLDNVVGSVAVPFREPYWNNRLTAVAAHGCDKEVEELDLL